MSGAPLSTADACTGTTDDDSNAEAMLSLLFEKCDEYRTGHVKSSCLVDKIRGWIWNNADADKRGLEDLRRRLNGHTNDEGSVTRGQFLEIAQEWLGTLMATKEQEQTGSAAAAPGTATTVNRTRIPVLMHHRPPKSLLPSFPPRPPTITNAANPLSGTPKSSLSEIMDASLGLLSPELLLEELNNSRDHTFGSMEGDDGI